MTMKKITILTIVMAFFVFLSCKDDNNFPSIKYSKGLKGSIQKGPFISGSNVTIQELDNELNATGISFSTTTNNDFGGFEINSKINFPYIEVITSGFFYNEVKGKISETNISLRSITDISTSTQTNVNLLTTLSKERIIYLIKNGGLTFNEAKVQAQKEILQIFNIEQSEDIDFNKLDISLDGDNNAILLAISVILQGDLSEGLLSEKISKIILDIKEDGTLDDPNLINLLAANAKGLNLINIRKNLLQRYLEIGHDATIPLFEKYAKRLTPLEVINTYPTIGEKEVPFSLDSINISFNKAIDVQTMTNQNIIITNSSGDRVSGNLKYDEENYKISFILDQELLPQEKYSVQLTEGIKGVDGEELVGGYNFEFTSLDVNTDKNLRAYYTFSNSADDITGNGFNASIINATFIEDINGVPNQACRLTGEGSYIELPNVVNITEPNWSYSIWVKLNSLQSPAMLLGTRLSGGAFWEKPLYVRSSNMHVASYNGSVLDAPMALSLNNWYHITAVVENSVLSLYVNGILAIKGVNYTPNLGSGDNSYIDFNGTDVGLFNYYSGKYFVSEKEQIDDIQTPVDGSVDNIRFYNRAINKYEVLELYNQKK